MSKPEEMSRGELRAIQLQRLILKRFGFRYNPEVRQRSGRQKEIAKELGVKEAWFTRALRGDNKVKGPERDELVRIAILCGTTFEEAFPDKDVPTPEPIPEPPLEPFAVGNGHDVTEDEKAVLRWLRRLAQGNQETWLRVIREVEKPSRTPPSYPRHKGKA